MANSAAANPRVRKQTEDTPTMNQSSSKKESATDKESATSKSSVTSKKSASKVGTTTDKQPSKSAASVASHYSIALESSNSTKALHSATMAAISDSEESTNARDVAQVASNKNKEYDPNKKTYLTDIAPELRNRIYNYIYDDVSENDEIHALELSPPSKSPIAVCKQVYAEMRQMQAAAYSNYWSNNVFVLDYSHHTFPSPLGSPGQAAFFEDKDFRHIRHFVIIVSYQKLNIWFRNARWIVDFNYVPISLHELPLVLARTIIIKTRVAAMNLNGGRNPGQGDGFSIWELEELLRKSVLDTE